MDANDTKVVPIGRAVEADREFNNAATVAFCEDLLARAKAGQIKHVIAITALPNDKVEYAWTSAEGIRPMTMLGGITALQFDYMHRVIVHGE